MSPQEIAHLYDLRAGLFDAREHIADTRNAVAIVRLVCPRLPSRILDLGCGEGHHLLEMSNAGYENLHGVDISREAIEIARRQCQTLPISLVCGNIAELDLDEFDLVTAFNSSLGSLGASGDTDYLRGVARALRPGGAFLLCYLSLDAARRRLGTFRSMSGRELGGFITTHVTISDDNRWMTLHQDYKSCMLPPEQIRIFDKAELSALMRSVGLHCTEEGVDRGHYDSLPYVRVVLARKA